MNKKLAGKNVLPILLGVVIILFFGLFCFQLDALKDTRKVLQEEFLLATQSQAKLQELLQVQEQVDILDEQVSNMTRLLPAEPQEEQLMLDINKIGENTGVTLNQIRFEKRIEQKNYTEMLVRMTFTGDYHSVVSLLGQILLGPRALRLNELSIVQDNSHQSSGLQVDISASVFYAGR